MGGTGRMRSWLLAIVAATAGALALEATGQASIGGTSVPPCRTANFSWLRYCTIGQAITGVSTLAAGSILTFPAVVAGSSATLKFQYRRMLRESA